MYLFRFTCSPGQKERNVQAENAIRPFIIRKESGRLCRNGFPRKRIPSLSGRWVPTICADRMASCTASCIILCHILVCKDRQRCGRGETVSVEFTLFMESRHGRGHKNRCRTVFMPFSGEILLGRILTIKMSARKIEIDTVPTRNSCSWANRKHPGSWFI